jgi:hypothetical protein
MGLKAKTPDRVGKAVGNGRLGVRVTLGAVHRLQEEVLEIQTFKHRRVNAILGKNDFQLVTALKDQ